MDWEARACWGERVREREAAEEGDEDLVRADRVQGAKGACSGE